MKGLRGQTLEAAHWSVSDGEAVRSGERRGLYWPGVRRARSGVRGVVMGCEGRRAIGES